MATIEPRAGTVARDPGDPVAEARALAAMAARAAPQAERDRRLPAELVDAIAAAGLFRMLLPADVGGLECGPQAWLDAVEALAGGDGAAGWCLAVVGTSGMLAAYLDVATAREIHCTPETIVAGVVAPRGRAVAVDGGYRVSGRWPFASAVDHADWLIAGCVVDAGDGDPQLLEDGTPDVRLMMLPAGDVEILDTWHVAGLRGTGSHDMAVADVLVPRARSLSLLTDQPRATGPLYVFPMFGMLALSIAAVGTGIAGAAIDDLVALAGAKTPTGSARVLADRPDTQAKVAQARAGLDAGRALVRAAVAEAWDAARAEGAITTEHRAALRRAATHAIDTSLATVETMYRLGGGSAVYESSPLQRRMRDIHVATQHLLVAPATWELTGRLLLGRVTDTRQL